MPFAPRFTYHHQLVTDVARIEASRAVIDLLPLPPDTSLRLRHDALQRSTRSSTQIEGNTLGEMEVRRAIGAGQRRGTAAEQEVRNYWRALDRVEQFSADGAPITEPFIRELHRIVIVRGAGRRGSRSEYRTTECPVVDTVTGRIDYGPPEPRDLSELMQDLVAWLDSAEAGHLPPPIRAGLLTHRFLSIHPFDDGNGRTARLIATADLWRCSYRMRGFLSFDEYFSADRARYYDALQMGLPVNFYDGRHDPDHTVWLTYFVGTIARAASSLRERAGSFYLAGAPQQFPWERLSRPQQQVLTRALARALADPEASLDVAPADIQDWFGVSGTTAREWLRDWTAAGFLEAQPSATGARVRRYALGREWQALVRAARASSSATG